MMLRLLCPSHQHSFVGFFLLQQLACWLLRRPSPDGEGLFLHDCTAAAVVNVLISVMFSVVLTLPSMLALEQEPPCNVWQPLTVMRSS